MAFVLERSKTASTPYVLIDEERGYMRFEGESFSESIVEFFSDISNWLSSYLSSDFTAFTFDCELKYFNSSTAKLLLNILMDIDEAAQGKTVTINWITTADDEINIECGTDFKEDMEHATFNLVLQ